MKSASEWKDFEIIGTGGGEKLERWGGIVLLRPDPQAIWRASEDFRKYKDLHAIYNRSESGGGRWQILKKFSDEWTIKYKDLKFIISPTSFKHTGLFPEQAVNWDRIREMVASHVERKGCAVEVLNLFGYTGGATVAAARAGARVTHVDSSRGMVEVCKRNVALNGLPNTCVRYIVDDCVKFVEREIRRGKHYDAIIMDPPSFGRGAGGEVWKIEESLDYLVMKCCHLFSDVPAFFLVNSYTSGLQPTVIKNVLVRNLGAGADVECYEIGLPTREGVVLPAGCSALATFKKYEGGDG